MSKHSITLTRDGIKGFLSSNSIGTDALNALAAIPGVTNSEIIAESAQCAQIEYTWIGSEAFDTIAEHLQVYGLRRTS